MMFEITVVAALVLIIFLLLAIIFDPFSFESASEDEPQEQLTSAEGRKIYGALKLYRDVMLDGDDIETAKTKFDTEELMQKIERMPKNA